MTDTLSAEDITDLDRIITEQAAGVTPYSDEIDRLVWEKLPALLSMAKRCLELVPGEDRYQVLKGYMVRAEIAEVERGRYRDMVVKLANIITQYPAASHGSLLTAPHAVAIQVQQEMLAAMVSDPDIAALLSDHVKKSPESLHIPETCKEGLQEPTCNDSSQVADRSL